MYVFMYVSINTNILMFLNVNQDFSRRDKIPEDHVHRDTFETESLTEPRGRLATSESQ